MQQGSSGEPVQLAARVLAAEAIRREVRPEEILSAIKSQFDTPLALSEQHRVALSRRYSQAMHSLVTAYFGQRDSGRTVIDGTGRRWHVYMVEEGARWDPEIEMRRHNWLCCHAEDARRFIAPVPPKWREWSEEILLAAIAAARPDNRAGALTGVRERPK